MFQYHCFICNTLLKQKYKSTNTISSSVVEKVFINVWKFPESIFSTDGLNDTKIVTSCSKCVKNIKYIIKVYSQLEELTKLLAKLQKEFQENLLKVEDENFSTNPYFENEKELRNKFKKGLSIVNQELVQNENEAMIKSPVLEDNQEDGEILYRKNESPKEDEDYIFEDNELSEIEKDTNEEEDDLGDRLACTKCIFTFKDEIARTAHLRKRHEGHKYPYDCDKCVKEFKTRRQFQTHIMSHTGETPFMCEHCGKGFRLEKLLKFHLMNKHTGGREFKCLEPNCSREFTTPSKLKSHQATHFKEFKYPCTICNKQFASTISLNLHMVQHSEANPWRCLQCEKSFSCHSALKNHGNVHTKKYKFQCDQCPFGGPSPSALERHKAAHQVEKAFRCELCENSFKYKKSLIKHLKCHAGLKSFECKTCNKAFIDNYKLLRHQMVHEGVKSFSCNKDGCEKSFYTKDALKSHCKSHEKIYLTKPVIKRTRKTEQSAPREESIILLNTNNLTGGEDDSLGLPMQEFHDLPIIDSFVQTTADQTQQLFHIPIITQGVLPSVDNIPLTFQDVINVEEDTTEIMNRGFSVGPIFHFQYLNP